MKTYKNFVEFWKDRCTDLKGSSHEVALESWGAGVRCGKATNDHTAICEWREDAYISGDPYYNTNCGDAFSLVDGSLKDNNYNYCPGCGGKIKLSRADL